MASSAVPPSPGGAAAEAPRNVVWQFAGRTLDERTLELTVAGNKVETEAKPLQVLLHLLRHAGEVVTKDELLESVWAGRIPSESVLTKAVAKLRAAIGDDEQSIILTVYGFGYRLAAEVRSDAPQAAAPPTAFVAGDRPPLRPNWTLQRALGGGGSGDVWLAVHDKTGEPRVFKFARDAGALGGLKREITLYRVLRETLGEHPGFVRVLDWNLETPPYFLESEYASGGSLPDWVEAQGGIGAVPLAARLELLAQAAQLLSLAHQAGVLHKDIKPANLLVDRDDGGAWRMRLSDFGSGAMLGEERLRALSITRLGFTQAVPADGSSGTPLYLAPEILAGSAPTARADVYALGVILYQLTVGDFRRPLAPGWEREVADPLLREDIAACADLDPQRRLGDPAELAQRLRTLDARRERSTVAAREQQEHERLQARVRRMRARRPWIVAVGLLLVAGLASTALLYAKALRAGREAAQAAADAQREAAISAAVNGFLVDDLIGAANPMHTGACEITLRQVLEGASDSAAVRFAAQPRTESAVRLAIGNAYVGLSDYARARAQFDAALARAADPRQAAAAQLALLWLLILNDQLDEARALRPQIDAAALPDEAERLSAEMAGAWLVFRAGEYEAAIAQLEALRPRYAAAMAPERPESIEFLERLGEAYWTAGRLPQAIAVFEDSLARTRKVYGERHPRSINTMQGLGAAYRLSDRVDEALAMLEPALQLARETLGPEHDYTLNVEAELGGAYQAKQRYAEAGELMGRALRVRRARDGQDNLIVRILMNNMANLYQEQGDNARALAGFLEVYEIEKRLNGENHPDTINEAHHVGSTYAAMGDWATAERWQRRTLAQARAAHAADYWGLGLMQYALADTLSHAGQRAEAEALFEESIALLTRTLGPEHRWTRKAAALRDAAS